MREIKFRGLRTDGKGWVYGNLIQTTDGYCYIFTGDTDDIQTCWMNLIKPETIGQYTGLKDRKGVEIYEGDICRILYTDWPSNTDSNIALEDYLISISHVGYIEYHDTCFYIMLKDRYDDYSKFFMQPGKHGFIEVIGNIHQHPDLLC